MDEEILSTKRFFQSQHIALSDFWLESCIQWCHEENPNINYTQETLHLKVYEQWLLLDLRDVEVPILPANLSQPKKVVLNGIYSLQMLQVVDISRSKFYQIQKLRNSNALINAMAEQENQTFNHGKRVLQLLLTDGTQEIAAIEYKPISSLNVNLPPGTKIRITGPVTVRRGQIMLEEKHVNVLGGEVEELLISNATENILAGALDLPLNPKPNIITEDSAPSNNNGTRSTANIINNQPPLNLLNNYINAGRQTNNINRVVPERNDSVQPARTNVLVQNRTNSDFISEDDELRIIEEVDVLLETERNMNRHQPCVFEDNLLNTDVVLRIDSPDGNERTTSKTDNKNTSSDTDKSLFEDMDIDAHLDVIDEQLKQANQNNRKQIGIAELLSNNITSGKFTIKAKFKSVTKKLTVADDAWSLKILITDDISDMEVSVHSDVISDLMGYYPAAVMALKKDILKKDEVATATVMKIIEGLKAKIMHLDCMMEITFAPDQACPTITKLK